MTWSYSPSQLATSTLYQIRRLIGDVLPGDQQLQDEEITWTAGRFTTVYGAAAECCRDIAAQFARKVDTVQGELRTMYSAQTKRYMDMARDFEMRGLRGAMPYAGGISSMDKNNVANDTDRVPPDFVRGQFDDLLPVAPTGQQTNTSSTPDNVSDQFP
jgi:hypothetical protein